MELTVTAKQKQFIDADAFLVEKAGRTIPEIFAAAIPICGAASPGKIAAAKNVKFRIYHGDADTTVPVECSRAAYKELRKAGADVEYFEFAGCGHASWNPAFNQPDFMEWLFAQKKSRRARK